MGFHHVDQDGLDLLTSWSTRLGLPKGWDYRLEPPHPAKVFFFKKIRIFSCFSIICWKDYLSPTELPMHLINTFGYLVISTVYWCPIFIHKMSISVFSFLLRISLASNLSIFVCFQRTNFWICWSLPYHFFPIVLIFTFIYIISSFFFYWIYSPVQLIMF